VNRKLMGPTLESLLLSSWLCCGWPLPYSLLLLFYLHSDDFMVEEFSSVGWWWWISTCI